MKKRIPALITAICAAVFSLGLTACVSAGDFDAHSWSGDWSHNIDGHWRNCTESNCKARVDEGAHEWELISSRIIDMPTCGEDGSGYYYCTGCGAVKLDDIPATGDHKYTAHWTEFEPTCQDDGQEWWECENCDAILTEPIPADGEHDFSGKWQQKEEGHYKVCIECGEAEETVHPHIPGEPVEKQPQGQEDGYIRTYCTECNYLIEEEVLANPNVLRDFTVEFKFGDGTYPALEEYDDSNRANPAMGEHKAYSVNLRLDSKDNVSTRYNVSFYKTVDGEKTALNSSNITALVYDENNFTEYHFDGVGAAKSGSGDTYAGLVYLSSLSTPQLRLKEMALPNGNPRDYHLMIFRYSAGGKVTAEVWVYITVV